MNIFNFIREHKKDFITIFVILLVDEMFFKGAFRERLKNAIHKMIDKFEKKEVIE